MIQGLSRIATSTCTTTGDEQLCVYEYIPEITYYDMLFISSIVIFLLATMTLSFFMRFYKTKGSRKQYEPLK